MLQKLRQWLEHKFRQCFSALGESFFVVEQDHAGNPVMRKAFLSVERWMGGLLPVFHFEKSDPVQLADVIGDSIKTTKTVVEQSLNEIPDTATANVTSFLDNSVKQRVGRTRTKVTTEVNEKLAKLNSQVLSAAIKGDRNRFRQLLMEKLSEVAEESFCKIIDERLAELVLRIREESLFDGTPAENKKSDPVPLPMGTRFHFQRGNVAVFVVEQSPTKRTIKVMADNGSPSKSYELSFPCVVFFVVMRGRKFDSLYVLFSREALRSVDDQLLCPAMSNIDKSFKVCFTGPGSATNVAETAERALENFWGSSFVLTHWPNYIDQISFEKWQEASKRDTLFGLSHPWRSARQSVSSMIETILKDVVVQEKKRKGRAFDMSALQKSVDEIAKQLGKEIREACFFLVQQWDLDQAVMETVNKRFDVIVADTCLVLRTELEEDIDGIFSEGALKRALEKATERTIAAVRKKSEQTLAAAQENLRAALRKETR